MEDLRVNLIRFNAETANVLKQYINGEKYNSIYDVMLEINEQFGFAAKGVYPPKDEIWADCLCYENLKVLEDFCWEEMDCENKEVQDWLSYLSICELSADKADKLEMYKVVDFN